jgi:hypothetical protein
MWQNVTLPSAFCATDYRDIIAGLLSLSTNSRCWTPAIQTINVLWAPSSSEMSVNLRELHKVHSIHGDWVRLTCTVSAYAKTTCVKDSQYPSSFLSSCFISYCFDLSGMVASWGCHGGVMVASLWRHGGVGLSTYARGKYAFRSWVGNGRHNL